MYIRLMVSSIYTANGHQGCILNVNCACDGGDTSVARRIHTDILETRGLPRIVPGGSIFLRPEDPELLEFSSFFQLRVSNPKGPNGMVMRPPRALNMQSPLETSPPSREKKNFRGSKQVLETGSGEDLRNNLNMGDFCAQKYHRFNQLFKHNSLVP
jgi:hypothetical protein